eukprot:CAMPEP_0115313896 /NCGR_PEP_ID=MMETSP0270-20121206/76726_1 /TAXON_ID=71861 /ORGANISM="Scrippsiella trochoidea, Strain CCMP3099" /LENGTH=53 /DNA_ID=CAMNT_0002733051 /DNA_START=49 /DNA_END=208 /DNA_ORIENTATION=-
MAGHLKKAVDDDIAAISEYHMVLDVAVLESTPRRHEARITLAANGAAELLQDP